MIYIHRNNFSRLAMDHYNNYFLKLGLDKKLCNLFEEESNPIKKSFYKRLYEDNKKIIIGKPDEIYKFLEELFHNHLEIMNALTNTQDNIKKLNEKLKDTKAQLKLIERKRRGINISPDERKDLNREKKRLIKCIGNISNSIELEKQSQVLGEEIRNDLTQNRSKNNGKGNSEDNSIFNYSKFRSYDRDGNPNKYGGYAFIQKLGINVCPYCNRIFTHSHINQGKAKATPQLDHFYSKKNYPFLSLSFYNLIPSCENCNSRLKGSKDFYKNPHLHPYENGFDDYLQFKIKLVKSKSKKDYVSIWTNQSTDAFEIILDKNEAPLVMPRDPEFFNKAELNIETFQLREMYQFHKDYVAELLMKAMIYNKDGIQHVINTFPELFKTREEAMRLITSNYVSLPDLEKRVLAKLTRDICTDLKWL